MLAGPPGTVLRVHHYRSKSALIWNGDIARSGFSAQTTFLELSPEQYAVGIENANLKPGWAMGSYFRETAITHIRGQVPKEPTPWISTTTDLDSAIWAIARCLALREAGEVHLAVIVPTTEIRIPATKFLGERNQNGGNTMIAKFEWLFYGRIFAKSIIADISWTRKVDGILGCS